MSRTWLVTLVALIAETALRAWSGEAAMIKRSLEELTRDADAIVIGTVTGQVSSWNDRGTAIHTDVTVAIDEHVKGSQGAQVTFRIAGGVVGGIGMRTSNDPVFHDGDRVIVFLHTGRAPPSLVGHAQGAYTVTDGFVTSNRRPVGLKDFTDAIRAVAP